MKRIILFFIAAVLLFSVSAQKKTTEGQLVVFLVRHAEKVDNSRDPELSEAGKQRAIELAETLKSAEIEFIHSTDFIRTRETAEPSAKQFRLDVRIYNPGNLNEIANKLKNSGGRHVVVGHSNTTPALVELLGGKSGEPINEENEYDRLYILTIQNNRNVNTVLLRYGEK